MIEEHNDGADESENCPFCGSSNSCEHLLLFVDLTFRTAEGGRLYDAFARRWGSISGEEDDDFDEVEAFDDLLDEVDSLADASCTKVREGGPGMTSEYGAYYCSSSERVTEAVQAFSDAADTLEVNDGSWESSEPVSEYPPSDATPSSSGEQRPRRRAVLVIVTDWPGGTMAFKFGSAMKAALQVQSEDIKLVQMGPERIFRAETDADERSFFEALSKSGVSYSGRVHFIEL